MDERAEFIPSRSMYHKPLHHVPVLRILPVLFSRKITFGISNKTTQFSWRTITFIDERFTRKGACKILDKVKVLIYFTVLLPTTGWSVPSTVLTLNGTARRVYEENSLAVPVTCPNASESIIHTDDPAIEKEARASESHVPWVMATE
jgi:hypothetical protein